MQQKICALVAAVLAFNGEAAMAASQPNTTLIYLDGKDSCRHQTDSATIATGDFGSWAGQFAAQVQAQATWDGAPPDFLLACLPTFGKPGKVTYTYVQAATETSAAVVENATLATDDFVDRLTQIMTREPASAARTYLAGHSYGGWLAMRVMSQMPAGAVIARLITIDPISPLTCTPAAGVADQLKYGSPVGCNEAPTDFSADDLAAAAAAAGQWLNYFETANAYLHASAIPQASLNVEESFAPVGVLAGLASERNPHLFLAQADATWAEFTSP